MENKKIIVIIGLLVVVLVALTLIKKDYVSAPEVQPVAEDQTNQATEEVTEAPELNFTEDDRAFCTSAGCELISCASGTIEEIEVAEGEVPFKCSDDSELIKQPF